MNSKQRQELWNIYAEICEGYGDAKYSPRKLERELPKGYSYGKEKTGKGDHKTAVLQVKSKSGKTYDTDQEIGGAHGGREKYSPSWADGHRKAKKTVEKVHQAIDDVQKSGKPDTKKRINKSEVAKSAVTKGKKALSDVTGRGRKTNVQGRGSRAARRVKELARQRKGV